MHSEQDAQDSIPRPRPELALAGQAIGPSLIVTDVNGLILFWNRGAEELYGWSAAEAIGVPMTALLVPSSAAEYVAAVLASLASGLPWSGEFQARHKTGRVFSARISTWPMRDGTGQLICAGLVHEARSHSDDHAPVLPAAAVGRPTADTPATFDSDAVAIEIVTRAFDPELRAAVDADPHGTVLPVDGLTLAELDDLLASLIAFAVHTTTVAAELCGSTPENVVASAALRLRSEWATPS